MAKPKVCKYCNGTGLDKKKRPITVLNIRINGISLQSKDQPNSRCCKCRGTGKRG